MSEENENKAKNEQVKVIKGRNGGILIPAQKGENRNNNSTRVGMNYRPTIFKNWLQFATTGEDPNGIVANMSIQDKIVLAQVKKALDGDTGAAIFLFDGAYGKVKEVIQQSNTNTEIDYSKFSAAELRVMEQAQRIMAGKLNEQRNAGISDAEIVE